jgi:hypothetical protein
MIEYIIPNVSNEFWARLLNIVVNKLDAVLQI